MDPPNLFSLFPIFNLFILLFYFLRGLLMFQMLPYLKKLFWSAHFNFQELRFILGGISHFFF